MKCYILLLIFCAVKAQQNETCQTEIYFDYLNSSSNSGNQPFYTWSSGCLQTNCTSLMSGLILPDSTCISIWNQNYTMLNSRNCSSVSNYAIVPSEWLEQLSRLSATCAQAEFLSVTNNQRITNLLDIITCCTSNVTSVNSSSLLGQAAAITLGIIVAVLIIVLVVVYRVPLSAVLTSENMQILITACMTCEKVATVKNPEKSKN